MDRMGTRGTSERIDTVIIGGGQAGLSAGYHLRRRGMPFVILEGRPRVGDVWRERWDSLRLFTPARFCGLDGMPFPAPAHSFPSKDDMADYLEAYADRFHLPVRTGARVRRLSRDGDRFTVDTGDGTIEARQVVVAMANYQRPFVPAFAEELDPSIAQVHSSAYRNPSQLPPGEVLVVGAGNSGAEIARELAGRSRVYLAGRGTGQIPFRIDGAAGRRFLVRLTLRGLFHRVLTVATPIGRKVRPKVVGRGGPLIRTKAAHLAAAGVERLPRIAGARDGRPMTADGRSLDVAAVVWCTGFTPGFDWIDLPLRYEGSVPRHRSGVVPEVPGLYFVGLHFLHALSSAMIHGVGRDAARVARAIAARAAAPMSRPEARGPAAPADAGGRAAVGR